MHSEHYRDQNSNLFGYYGDNKVLTTRQSRLPEDPRVIDSGLIVDPLLRWSLDRSSGARLSLYGFEQIVRIEKNLPTHVYFVLLINIVEFTLKVSDIDLQLAPTISAMRIADATMRERANHRRFLVSLFCNFERAELFASGFPSN